MHIYREVVERRPHVKHLLPSFFLGWTVALCRCVLVGESGPSVSETSPPAQITASQGPQRVWSTSAEGHSEYFYTTEIRVEVRNILALWMLGQFLDNIDLFSSYCSPDSIYSWITVVQLITTKAGTSVCKIKILEIGVFVLIYIQWVWVDGVWGQTFRGNLAWCHHFHQQQ